MGAPKRYFHVQTKLYYMDGQLGKHRYKISKMYIYLGGMKRFVTSGWKNWHQTKRMVICMVEKGCLVGSSIEHMFLRKKNIKIQLDNFK